MNIELETQGDVCILRISGRLVTGMAPKYLHEKLSEVRSLGSAKVLADLRELVSIGSVGIGFLVGVHSAVTDLPGGRFMMVGSQKHVEDVLKLTRLSSIIPMPADMESGMALVRGEGKAANSGS